MDYRSSTANIGFLTFVNAHTIIRVPDLCAASDDGASLGNRDAMDREPDARADAPADLGSAADLVHSDADDRERPRMMPCNHDWHSAGAYPELDEWRCVKCGAGRVGKP